MGDANEAEGSTKKIDQNALQIAKGLAAFQKDEGGETILDKAGAEAFKTTYEEMLAGLAAEEKALTGKDNKKARTEKSKEISAKKNDPQYIDACKVCKGLEPKNGFFATKPEVKEKKEEVVEEKKEEKKVDKKPKKDGGGTGISGEERKELETLKTDLIARKSELKAAGMSGGQQNKDEQVMGWVKRMNELKEKECPGSTGKPAKEDKNKKKKKGALSSEDQAEFEKLIQEVELYKGKLKTEFGYSNKDIKADPELQEMEAKVKAFEKRA